MDMWLEAPVSLTSAWIETVANLCMKSRTCAQHVVEGGIFEQMCALLSYRNQAVQTCALHIYDVATSLEDADARKEMLRREAQLEYLADQCRSADRKMALPSLHIIYKLSSGMRDSALTVNRSRVLRDLVIDIFRLQMPRELAHLAALTICNFAAACVKQSDVGFARHVIANDFVPQVLASLKRDGSLIASIASPLLKFLQNFHLLLPHELSVVDGLLSAGVLAMVSAVVGATPMRTEERLAVACILCIYTCSAKLYESSWRARLGDLLRLLSRISEPVGDKALATVLTRCIQNVVCNRDALPKVTKMPAFQHLIVGLALFAERVGAVANALKAPFEILRSSRITMNLPEGAVKALIRCDVISEADCLKFQGHDAFDSEADAIQTIKDLIFDSLRASGPAESDGAAQTGEGSGSDPESLRQGAEHHARFLAALGNLREHFHPAFWIDEAIVNAPTGVLAPPAPWQPSSREQYDAEIYGEEIVISCFNFPIESVERRWNAINSETLNRALHEAEQVPFKFVASQVILAPTAGSGT
eukprot:scaffold2602_cov246-Pinguiococcus_pyrenoidosus.AAC.11